MCYNEGFFRSVHHFSNFHVYTNVRIYEGFRIVFIDDFLSNDGNLKLHIFRIAKRIVSMIFLNISSCTPRTLCDDDTIEENLCCCDCCSGHADFSEKVEDVSSNG